MSSQDGEVDESPHPVIIRKNHLGFGFNVRGQVILRHLYFAYNVTLWVFERIDRQNWT